MKLKRVNCQDGKPYGYRFHCPGCEDGHLVPTSGQNAWGFNDNVDKPTFTPSILVHETKKDGIVIRLRCHSFVVDGRIEFLSDCGHTLAGKTVDLPDIKEP